GPTETTVEAVVAAVDGHARPAIGRPTLGTRAYVMDHWLRPVPGGVAGELYLAGDQLTRGYLARPAETAARFVGDPDGRGGRMYRTGDVVRRLPDGGLEFLGRTDGQLKIRGFRVEPGEVVAALTCHDGVRAAHVAARNHSGGPRLAAYVAGGANPPTAAELRSMLIDRLPRYLVPHHIVVLGELPLTPHGKIDDNVLATIELGNGPVAPPETPTEIALAGAFTDVLGTADVDVTAGFLEMGLDSIVALSVVQAARRRGVALRARLMVECETIRELGAAIDSDAPHAPGNGAVGTGEPIPLLPNAHWLCEYGSPRRLAQTEVVRLPDTVTRQGLDAVLGAVLDGHEVLRCRLDRDAMALVPQPDTSILREVWGHGEPAGDVAAHVLEALEDLDPQAGRLMTAMWLREPDGPGVLVLTAHVLAMDPASWRIVLGELDAGLHALAAGRTPTPAREHTSYRRWSRLLTERAGALATEGFWAGELEGADPPLGTRRVRPVTDRAGDLAISVATCDAGLTARLLSTGQPIGDLLVTAAARTVTAWRRRRGQDTPAPLLALETHGRADIDDTDETVDTSETVGLLSAIYPLRVHTDGPADVARIPGSGIDYGLLRYLRSSTRLREHPEPQLLLNYLGIVHAGVGDLELDRELLSGVGPVPEPDQAVRHELTVVAGVLGADDGRVLATQWRTLPDILTHADLEALQNLWMKSLREMVT
ncbi:MAG: mycobactin peptide synthetase MbtF, partial [Mycobacterium sp.]|nr:mycobactin peptide synthetase MbtF [Mycobacterium sp.]